LKRYYTLRNAGVCLVNSMIILFQMVFVQSEIMASH
jgi:hypothetical protein